MIRIPAAVLAGLLATIAPLSATESIRGGEQPVCGELYRDQVREIDFHLYFPTEEAALDAAAELDHGRFEHQVRTSASSAEWLLRIVFRDVPTRIELDLGRRKVKALAKRHDVSFPGFGCRLKQSAITAR
jgi:hypothetical protein